MTYNALSRSAKYRFDYVEIDSNNRSISADYDVYVFNYHPITMAWLDTGCIRKLKGVKLTLVLEVLPNDPFPMCPRNAFDGYLVPDPTIRCEDQRVFAFPRPLEMVEPQSAYVDPPVPVIGTFGFATRGKGFEKVVDAVNREFDAAVVRINIPHGTYVANSEEYAKTLADACVARAKKGIEVRVTHDYMTKQQLVDWCASNTLNCFLYDRNMPGLAATTDQAILSMRPLSVSQNDAFRHILQYVHPYPEWSLRDSIAKSVTGVAEMKADWAPDKFAERFECVLSFYRVSEVPRQSRRHFVLRGKGKIRRLVESSIHLVRSTPARFVNLKRSVFQFITLKRMQYQRTIVRKYDSYSQAGEDLIVSALFRSFGVKTFTYLDVGANHPDFISNTYLFYKMGCRGVCVEPNPVLYKKHRSVRPEDTCLNVGVGIDERKEADFYLFSGHTDGLSTFSKSEAEYWATVGMDGIGKIRPAKVIKMPLTSISEIIAANGVPDFVSIDAEGLDLEILQSMNFDKYVIKCFCVETLKYDENKKGFRDTDLISFMKDRDYFVYADTGINSIFVNRNWFETCQKDLELPEVSKK